MTLKKPIIFFLVILLFISCEKPRQFSELVLQDKMITLNNETVQFKDVIDQYKGKKVVIDVWASWCSDCIKGLPNLYKLQKETPEVKYLFLSVDKTEGAWKKAINRYKIKGDHYFIKEGLDGNFGDFLNSNWTPRYMVLDEEGNISLFKATKITDKRIKELIQ